MLPQLEWDLQGRMPAPIVEERLLRALAASAWVAASLQSWQCRGGKQPFWLSRTEHSGRPSQAELLRWRHNKLAHTHSTLLKVSAWRHARSQLEQSEDVLDVECLLSHIVTQRRPC